MNATAPRQGQQPCGTPSLHTGDPCLSKGGSRADILSVVRVASTTIVGAENVALRRCAAVLLCALAIGTGCGKVRDETARNDVDGYGGAGVDASGAGGLGLDDPVERREDAKRLGCSMVKNL